MPLPRSVSALLLSAPALAAPASAQCPLTPLPVSLEKLDALGNPDPSFAGVGRDVAVAPGVVAVSSILERLFSFQSPDPFKGAVWILEPDAQGTWVETEKLRGPSFSAGTFGLRIEFADPDTLLVGNPGNCPVDCVQTGPSGEVTVFERDASGWTETQVLASPVPFDNDSFGVALAADGNLLAVGAPAGHQFTPDEVGSVHVFERTPSGWQHRARILPPGPQWAFGREVDLAGDLLVVADPPLPGFGGFPGAAHLFRMGAGPDTWTLETTLQRQPHDTIFTRFAESVATDGTHVAVGVPMADLTLDPFAVLATEPGAVGSGRVDVFEDTGSGFVRTASLAPPAPEIGAFFGVSVAVDGGRIVAGMPGATNEAGVRTGAAHAFELRDGLWTPLDVLEVTTFDGVNPTGNLDGVGHVVDLLGDRVVLATTAASFPGVPERGAAGLFDLDGPPCDDRDLLGAPGYVSLELGGTHVFGVRPGAASAGAFYLLLGSASGTAPGFVLNGVPIPLNPDPYFTTTLRFANKGPFVATLGVLDAAGHGTAAFALPAATDPDLTGLALHHAALLLDPSLALVGATVPARVALVP